MRIMTIFQLYRYHYTAVATRNSWLAVARRNHHQLHYILINQLFSNLLLSFWRLPMQSSTITIPQPFWFGPITSCWTNNQLRVTAQQSSASLCPAPFAVLQHVASTGDTTNSQVFGQHITRSWCYTTDAGCNHDHWWWSIVIKDRHIYANRNRTEIENYKTLGEMTMTTQHGGYVRYASRIVASWHITGIPSVQPSGIGVPGGQPENEGALSSCGIDGVQLMVRRSTFKPLMVHIDGYWIDGWLVWMVYIDGYWWVISLGNASWLMPLVDGNPARQVPVSQDGHRPYGIYFLVDKHDLPMAPSPRNQSHLFLSKNFSTSEQDSPWCAASFTTLRSSLHRFTMMSSQQFMFGAEIWTGFANRHGPIQRRKRVRVPSLRTHHDSRDEFIASRWHKTINDLNV